VDGLSQVFAVNTLAPYLLTALIDRPKRLVYLSSRLHENGDPSLDDLTWAKRPWNGQRAYSDTKLHDVLLAFVVARLWPETFSNALTPGWVRTRMGGPELPTISMPAVVRRCGSPSATIQPPSFQAVTSTICARPLPSRHQKRSQFRTSCFMPAIASLESPSPEVFTIPERRLQKTHAIVHKRYDHADVSHMGDSAMEPPPKNVRPPRNCVLPVRNAL